jgi:hypothetical protein
MREFSHLLNPQFPDKSGVSSFDKGAQSQSIFVIHIFGIGFGTLA